MSDEQIQWISTNIRVVIVMAAPFAIGIAFSLLWLVWKRRFGMRELLFLVTYFSLCCGFALWLRYGRRLPIPSSTPEEAESLERIRLGLPAQ